MSSRSSSRRTPGLSPRRSGADFNTDANKDDLYNWNSLRSQYLAEANNQIAGDYAGGPGFDPGWYWDPYMLGYTYIGFGLFDSPFGWGFYPFGWEEGWTAVRYGGREHGGPHGRSWRRPPFTGDRRRRLPWQAVSPAGGGFHGGGGFGGGGHRQ